MGSVQCRLSGCATVGRAGGQPDHLPVGRRRRPGGNVTSSHHTLDDLDRRLLALFAARPRLGVLEASRQLKVARGTVQARLDRLTAAGVITGWGPEISPEALGYGVTAFVSLEIDQALRQRITAHLERIPQVLECWTVTGNGDLWCRLVARSNADLQDVINVLVADPGILRTSTVIGLSTEIAMRTQPLVQHREPRR
ncbi:Lrp/AsnC family transcriptional regulator [Desertihabitans brevis]|uniref:Lrp/AsnC family transcriptional regulator n=1 Tax=Desertihabitans brevis TaxID=2268447 RepID=A0A367Z0H9_9ACTN|nr:Lrp/AsnC family transcriptional regulator [Desertihabitans brevis]